MKNFLKRLGAGLLKIGTTAVINAIKNPKTTTAGIGAISAGVGAITAGPLTPGNISTAIIGIIGGAGLLLADDPAAQSQDIKNE